MEKDTNIIIHLKIHTPSSSSPPRKALHVQSRSYWAPANIGPYSQAISIPLHSNNQNSPACTVSIAGQIALLPPSMALPPPTPDDPNKDFKLQLVLSLQHLWRIGIEMNVQWWTSAVIYLPRSSSSLPLSSNSKARLAARAWIAAHRPFTDDDDDESRDLWEEKHYAGKTTLGTSTAAVQLPDWEILGDTRACPPVFAVEVEELPRGAAVEWHAHLGISEATVQVSLRLASH